MTETKKRELKAKQAKGGFAFILKQAFKFSPFFLIPRVVIYYFLDEKPFEIRMIFEWLMVSFFTSLGVCAVNWYFQKRLYEKSLSQSTK
jgi:hypothetical protein